ncbi:EF Tu GTP binding domain-containing protein [Scleroderma citrinum]
MTQPSKKTGDGILSRTSSGGFDQRLLDIAALNLTSKEEPARIDEPPPRMTLEREKLLEEARRFIESSGQKDKKSVSLVVIGHVDAGKSTLMGRLLYELGRIDEKTRVTNERGSSKVGKSSFSWAWGLDGTTEERERGITMDIALQSLTTPHRQVTILDAPGHKDFIPNMISGASQADCALLVVDAATGEFEAGFDRGGQTREHILLVRSLGVSQLIVAVNKLDQVNWSQARYEDICGLLRSFLGQSGFHPSKMGFVPVGAMLGVNLVDRNSSEASELSRWYQGPTLVDLLDELEPPTRDIESPLRIPISNVFKGQSSGTGISGRICGGVVQVGERVRVLPGDETAIIRSINIDENSVSWAAAGSNVTLYLTSIDPIHLNIGSVLCSPGNLVPLATVFSARIIVFDIQVPITSGASIELFHHSRDVPAMISKLVSSLDRASGTVVKKGPRVLSKSMSAEVQITLRGGTLSAPSAVARPIPLEPFSMNKDMGRILVRRGGETIAAGIVLDIIG